jgi:hypothetical protein
MLPFVRVLLVVIGSAAAVSIVASPKKDWRL